jgi:hypothetical protein
VSEAIYYDRLGELIYAAVIKFAPGISSQNQELAVKELKKNPATIQVFTALGSFGMIILFHAETPTEAQKILRENIISKECFESYDIAQITDIFSIYRHFY